ncbi:MULTISPECIES: alpha/beta hydrolase family protein [unclassified Streptomyces]|uniref:alpha/beta hydrolase family protein n=1 Tax=unclassified Streptomyces TaxID=2593676 RepID=UPI0022B67FBD|nr:MULTISPECIES: alpha/beta fold hydrolase [unclassified Streptomyces]MCZ7413202.1 alpha/beta fold hydrolase [Streptomyces sp. WMMC897]MCZ7430195.1 alpha/beta fold hydrolase [Streptomyces sp. WMMC1477]
MSATTEPVELTIPARDGYSLAATRYGSGPNTVVINSATAVPRGYYRSFATALAERGYSVYTYDYRGIGDSRPPATLRGFPATATDWVLSDMAGVLDHVTETVAAGRLLLIGHSFGGQVAGLLDNTDAVAGMVTVSAQSGYWRYQARGQRLPVAFHTRVTLPLLSHAVGYVPWSRLSSSALDLPKGVALQWSRWCRDPRYLLADDTLPTERYEKFDAPVLAYSVEDDSWGTARSVDAMMSAYPNLERRHLDPADHQLRKLGHFGFFRRGAQAVWADAFAWLDDRMDSVAA